MMILVQQQLQSSGNNSNTEIDWSVFLVFHLIDSDLKKEKNTGGTFVSHTGAWSYTAVTLCKKGFKM